MADEPESRVALFLAVDIIATMISLAFVCLRIGYRHAKNTLGLSDYMILAAMGTALVHMVLDIIITTNFGYARHQSDLPPELRGSWKTSLMFWLIQIFTKFPLMFSKLSLCLMYRELLRGADSRIVRISRIINWIAIVLVAGFFTAITFVGIFACTPIQKSWYSATPGQCVDTTITVNYVTSSVNILTSLMVIYIPLPVLLQTKNKRIEIKQLIALVLLGLIDTVISCVRLYMIGDLHNVRTDFTWIVIPTHLVIVIELNVTIIAASLVVMRPCFQAIFNRLFPNSIHNSSNVSRSMDQQYNSRSGYILSSNGAGRAGKGTFTDGDLDPNNGITKTVNIEMSSRSVSTEDILRSKDRF